MCRYNSGFFFRHKLLEPYKWYWRVEPDVDFTCDIQFDPFLYMQDHNKTYGFTVSLIEFGATIPTLWQATKGKQCFYPPCHLFRFNHKLNVLVLLDFIKQNPKYVAHENALPFITEDDGESYNNCHFWSNFEISDLDFWRSPAYLAYFNHLDRAGGFYYERWGDAPVHSLAAALFLPKQQLHFFAPIGYEHAPHNHCPLKSDGYNDNHCQCGPEHTFGEHTCSKWAYAYDGLTS
jgi:alpha 1,2-mannosyltransferase